MSNNDAGRIQALQQRISEWDAEHEHELNQLRETQQSLKQTLALSLRVAVLGSIPSVVWILCWVSINCVDSSKLFFAVQTFGALVVFGTVLAGAARASGLMAHWWFLRSGINQRMATIIVTLTTDAILFGWVVVLVNW